MSLARRWQRASFSDSPHYQLGFGLGERPWVRFYLTPLPLPVPRRLHWLGCKNNVRLMCYINKINHGSMHNLAKMLTHVHRAKTWQGFICVSKVYKSGKCCKKENKEAVVFALSVNKLGLWAEATEHQKVFSKPSSQTIRGFSQFLNRNDRFRWKRSVTVPRSQTVRNALRYKIQKKWEIGGFRGTPPSFYIPLQSIARPPPIPISKVLIITISFEGQFLGSMCMVQAGATETNSIFRENPASLLCIGYWSLIAFFSIKWWLQSSSFF